jgi:hypothetical protein
MSLSRRDTPYVPYWAGESLSRLVESRLASNANTAKEPIARIILVPSHHSPIGVIRAKLTRFKQNADDRFCCQQVEPLKTKERILDPPFWDPYFVTGYGDRDFP